MAIAAAELAGGAEGAGVVGAEGTGAASGGAAARPTPAPAARPARAARPKPKPSAGQRAGRVAQGAGQLPARTLSAARATGVGRGSALSRLLTAFAVGAIALEVMSYITGQYFSVDWQGLGQHPLQPAGSTAAYVPLYPGQGAALAAIATGAAPATIPQQSQAAQIVHASQTGTVFL